VERQTHPIFRRTAQKNQQSRESNAAPLTDLGTLAAPTHCFTPHPTAFSVSVSHEARNAPDALATYTTDAVSAITELTVQHDALTLVEDPRCVFTPINVDLVAARLESSGIADDWAHVVNSLREDFDTRVPSDIPSTYIPSNHNSCSLNPSFISDYIIAERAAGRLSEAYDPTLLESIIGPFRSSPLRLVHSNKWRMIQDFSFPRNVETLVLFTS
jgi:hypothetical protein